LDPIQAYIKVFTHQFEPKTHTSNIVKIAFKIIASFILLPFILSSNVSIHCFQTNRNLWLPGYIANLFKFVGMPSKAYEDNMLSGEVHTILSFGELYLLLSKYDSDTIAEIFTGTAFSTIIGDTYRSKEFLLLWNDFVSTIKKISDYEKKKSYHEMHVIFCDLIDSIFIDMSNYIYKSKNLCLNNHKVSNMYYNKLGIYKFRNRGRDFPGIYFVQSKGKEFKFTDVTTTYMLVFYLFKAEIVNFNDQGSDDLPLVGGGIAMPDDTCIDLTGVTYFDIYLSMFSLYAEVVPGKGKVEVNNNAGKEVGVRNYSTYTNISIVNKYEVYPKVVCYKYRLPMDPYSFNVLIS
jgi:hypothetical protein